MGTISKQYTFSAGATIVASEHNANFDDIINVVNGNIENVNIKSTAAIVDTKLAQITTAAKVAFSALTVASQASGDIAYYSGSAWTRLAASTESNYFLKTQGTGGSAPVWTSLPVSGFASSAEVVTGTETAKAVAPNTMVSHQGVCKGWVNFNGTTGTLSAADSFNVSGLTDNGTGDYTVTWDTDFGSVNYCLVGACKDIGSAYFVQIEQSAGLAAGSSRVQVKAHDSSTGDSPVVCVMAIGDR